MTALISGTFDPFTLGHKSIVDRTLLFADKVIIGIGINRDKHNMFPMQWRIDYINKIYEKDGRVCVMSYEGLTTDFAKKVDANCIVRGVRSNQDFEYERQLADINKKLANIDTLLMLTDERYSCISSSMIRELIAYGKDVNSFVPIAINGKEYINPQ